jgi:hypothetical protein
MKSSGSRFRTRRLGMALVYMPMPGVKQENPPLKYRRPNLQHATPKGKFGRRLGGVTRSKGTSSHLFGPSSQPEPSFVSWRIKTS